MKKILQAQDVQTVEDAIALIGQRDIQQIKVAATDIDGVLRGKYIHRKKFISTLKNGLGFCDVIFGWDSGDALYDRDSITGWNTAFPDALGHLDVTTCRELPLEQNTVLFLMDFAEGGAHRDVDPRSLLKRVIARGEAMGITFRASAEFEFFLFNETPRSVREKDYRHLENITPGMFGYSMIRNTTHADFYHELMDLCRTMDMEIEGIHTETGPGVLEVALYHDELLRAADKAALFKTFTKVLAQTHGMMATFMAKWSPDWPGQSGHLHLSMTDKNTGESAFYDASKEHNMSDAMRWFVGGQQQLMPEVLAMVSPTVNSFSRLIPGFWAPTDASWGFENRTCALRGIGGSPNSQRVEYRVAAADINPYIALAAALGSGLWGIENQIEPDPSIVGSAYDVKFPKKRQFPRTLMEAAGRLKASKPARELFGDAFVEHYAATREWEEREFRKHITDWEMQRYFEII